eukprot:CAMPEP_0185278016 /NCGR_PEP_ID=MMETSP1359-20130426/59994_1 /TAXON_ID=552665 /ORGANISM="Bigelowiella longifila, Strain CCMP242" /LENGTH=212 /DNA_ID=CAMNT_0027872351 /DNA_START=267 /DNA_END=905 /DNA_ORIENTATION=-
MAKFWDLNKDIILMQKLGHPSSLFENEADDMGRADVIQYLHQHKPLPQEFRNANIRKVEPVVIILWRPHCLRVLSSSIHWYTLDRHLQDLRRWIKIKSETASRGIPTFVLNFGDMLFNQVAFRKNLNKVQCMGNIDFDFVPRLYRDVWPGNHYKIGGSIADYVEHLESRNLGARHLGFNESTGTCNQKAAANKTNAEMIKMLEEELAHMSRW